MSMNPSTSVVSISGEKMSGGSRAFQGVAALREFQDESTLAPAATLPNVAVSTDVLVQLRSNLAQLEELHSRLRFVMSEISYLIKRD